MERAQAELQTLRSQNQTLLAVVSCQAATIEQVTAGGAEQALEREAAQQRLLAQQSEQLAALQAEMLRLRRDSGGRREGGAAGRRESGSPSKLALASPTWSAASQADVVVQQQQAELEERRLQQASAQAAHESALAEARGQARELSTRAGLAERRVAQLEAEVEALTEQGAQAADEAAAARQELARLGEVEQRFSELAAEMGCVDEQGRLMQGRLEELTAELMQARLDEAQHLAWLRDVKAMMASGAEDGLAMALAQTMEESHRKGELLKQRDAELKALRGGRPAVGASAAGAPAGRASPLASGRSKPAPLSTAAVRPASSTSAPPSRATSARSASGSSWQR